MVKEVMLEKGCRMSFFLYLSSDLAGSKGGYFPSFSYCDFANGFTVFEGMPLVVFQGVIRNYKVHGLIGLVAII